MRVLFDGYWWADGPPSNRAVQREIIAAWCASFPADRVAIALRRGVDASDVPAGARVVRTVLWPHGLSNLLELRRGADAVVVHNFAPPGAIVFVHDAMFVEHPSWFSRRERAYFAAMLPLARHATVVTSSRAEAARIARVWRVRASPIGLGLSRARIDAAPRAPAVAAGLADFALTVGRLTVRKNLAAVLAAAAVSERITPASPLIVVGSGAHAGRSDDVRSLVANLPDPRLVRVAGRLDDAELAWLYRRAAVVISLSRDEGFGMTPLEGLAFGAPLVVSDIPAHRETVRSVATLVDPDASAIEHARAIDAAWGRSPDPLLRAQTLTLHSWGGVVARLRATMQARSGRTRLKR